MKNRKKIFFTSDLHFFHENVIHFAKRPFKDVNHMHEVLISNYNATVPEDGVCYILGDVGFHKTELLKPLLDRMNGTKILIMGNHCKSVGSMYSAGFAAVLNSASLFIAKELVTMSHYPLKGIIREDTSTMRGRVEGDCWHGETRAGNKALENNGQFSIHGHIHSPNSGKSKTKLGRQWDIGVDGNNYRPVSISQIESWIWHTKAAEEAGERTIKVTDRKCSIPREKIREAVRKVKKEIKNEKV